MGSRFLMKICVFNGDAFLSGANMSLVDWIKNDTSNEYWIILPKSGVKSHDFDNIAKNVHVVNGNYFATAKHLRKKSGLENVKLTIKSCYMKVCYKQSIRKRLLSLIQDISPDVILSNTFSVWIGADIATSLDIPHFWHVREFMDLDHGLEHENPEMIRDLASKSNAIFISKAIESYYLKKYKFKSSKVIYNQISYNKNIVNESPRFNDKKVRAIFVGQLLENKGVMDAVKAASRVHEDGYEFSLDIYGKGSLENTFRKYINDNSIKEIVSLGRKRWKIENEGFYNQKHRTFNISHLNSRNDNAMKVHYFFIQFAHTIRQLLEQGNLLTKSLKLKIKEVSRFLLYTLTSTISDLNNLETNFQLRFDD